MKKLISVVLAVILVMGMAFSASAAVITTNPTTTTSKVTGGIRGINEDDYLSLLEDLASAHGITLNDKEYIRSLSDLSDLEVNPGDVIKIKMTGNLFVDKNGNLVGGSGSNVSLSALSLGDIQVRSTCTNGEGVAKITLDGNKNGSYIKIEFSKSPEYSGKKFSYSIYLSSRGSRKSTTRIPLRGILETEVVEVSSNDDYIDLSDGATIKAVTNIRNIELYLGEYVSMVRHLTRGNTYSGVATTDILSKDERLFTKYRGLEYVYRLQTVNLKAEGNIVRFDLDDVYYVYNTNGTYLGTTKNALPYWTTYYLSVEKYANIEVVR